MAADHVQRIREALPVFLAESVAPTPPDARAKGSTFTPDPRVRKLLELANVDVDKYFNRAASDVSAPAPQHAASPSALLASAPLRIFVPDARA